MANNLKNFKEELDVLEVHIIASALEYWESQFGMTDKEAALLNRFRKLTEGVE